MDKKKKEVPSASERQKVLDSISAEELAKIEAHHASTKGSDPVDEEWLLITEFAMTFGWQAYLDTKADKIKGAEMRTLIAASRKLKAGKLYDQATASFIGAVSAQSKKPGQTFKSLTKDIINQTKADE